MKLQSCIFTENPCYLAGRTITPKGIMVHSTGANNPTLRRYVQPDDGMIGKNSSNNHWNQESVELCVHAFIGKCADNSIATYQVLPWNHRAWHCGVGTSGTSANNTHVSFEICEDGLDDLTYFKSVYQEAAELCAMLCQQFQLNPLDDGVILCHSEGYKRGVASNHGDVMHWFPKHGKTMEDFRQCVASIMKLEEEETLTKDEVLAIIREYEAEKTTSIQAADPDSWSAEARAWAEEEDIIEGLGAGKMQFKAYCTREMMVVFLHRFWKKVKVYIDQRLDK